MRTCKRIEEVKANVRMTRARSAAAAAEPLGKKRKVGGGGELDVSTSLKTQRLDDMTAHNSVLVAASKDSEHVSDHGLTSCCSSNGSSELEQDDSKLLNLEEENDSVEFRERGEVMSRVEEQESGELESTAKPHKTTNIHQAEMMPSEAEIEEFFAKAEKDIQKQFSDKYNYDIVKDKPLEGRYEWVEFQPKRP